MRTRKRCVKCGENRRWGDSPQCIDCLNGEMARLRPDAEDAAAASIAKHHVPLHGYPPRLKSEVV